MQPSQKSSACAVYDDLGKAEHAIDELRQAGFREDEIGIIGHVSDGTVPTPADVNAPEENAINALVKGSIVGAVIGAFVIVVVPGLGEVAGLGKWFDVLGGAIVGAAACGVMVAFSSFLLWQPRTRFFNEELEKGNFIVTVKNPARQEEAAAVLRHEGTHVEKG